MDHNPDTLLQDWHDMRLRLTALVKQAVTQLRLDAVDDLGLVVKAALDIVKLIDAINKQEKEERLRGLVEQENRYTPYDEIPPLSPEDTARLDARLDDIFNRLRRAAIADGLYEGIDPDRESPPARRLEEVVTELSKMPQD